MMDNIIEIEAAISLRQVIIKCAFCKGEGRFTVRSKTEEVTYQCPRCDSKGKLLIEANHLPLIACESCQGTGTTQPLDKLDLQPVDLTENWLAKIVCSACGGCGCQAQMGPWRLVASYPVTRDSKSIIYLTGMTEPEFLRALNDNQPLSFCYLCKRRQGENSMAIIHRNQTVCSQVELVSHRGSVGSLTYAWLLCQECALLLGLLS